MLDRLRETSSQYYTSRHLSCSLAPVAVSISDSGLVTKLAFLRLPPTALRHSLNNCSPQQLTTLKALRHSLQQLAPKQLFTLFNNWLSYGQLSVTLSNNWLSYGLPPTALRHSLQQLAFLRASSNSSPSLSSTTGFPMGFLQQLSVTLSNNWLSLSFSPTTGFLSSSNSSPSLSPTTGFSYGLPPTALRHSLQQLAFLRASQQLSALSLTTGFPSFLQQLSVTLSNNWLSYGLPPTALHHSLQQLAFLWASSNSSPSLSPTTGFPTGFLQQLSVTLSTKLQQLAFLLPPTSLSPTTGFPTGFFQQLSITLFQQLAFLRASSNSSPSLSPTTGFSYGFLQQLSVTLQQLAFLRASSNITLSNNWLSYGLPPTALRHSLQQLAFLWASSSNIFSITLSNKLLSYGHSLNNSFLRHSLQNNFLLLQQLPSLSPTTGFPTGFLQQLSITLSNNWLSYGLPPTALHHSLQQLVFLRASSNSSPSLSPTTGFPTGFLLSLKKGIKLCFFCFF
ncbi:hypothetical protein C7M84_002292 [Penaeus vannamei]|uniref:Uncharacterized protein n=1 Tax=Penaeus vannamei TaxID=6689 RepID=A0A3R7P968_PENVA|nr:hypothetical protein C7M84_002292 [Penaeus vannamei]